MHVLLPTMNDSAPKTKRHVLRYSLRVMLLLLTVIGVALGWTLHNIRDQGIAVAALEKLGCNLGFADSTLSVLPWTGTLVGKDGIRNVVFFDSLKSHINDSDLALLRGLPHLKSLHLASTHVTDAGLVNVQGLTELVELSLPDTQVGGQGLANLEGLKQLQWLDLDGTQVTDADLIHFRGMKNLTTLRLKRTKVTNAGAQELQKALPNCKITF
jgi:hypothetical protein